MKQSKLRVGVIGVGHLGEYHVQKYQALSTAELIGVVDTNPERADEISHLYSIKAYGKHDEILNNVDAVSLAVPTEAHFEVAKDILSKGIHLLIEKPITYNIEPADTLISMAGEKDLVLQVGLVERFNPAVIRMESMLNQPVLIEAHRMNPFTTRGTDVDVVLDLMIHDLDIILHIIPFEVKEVHAVGMSVLTDKTDIANARITFKNGTIANLTASRVSNKALRKIRVFQQDSFMEADCFKREFSMIRLDNGIGDLTDIPKIKPKIVKFPGSDPLADQISSFVDAVMNGSEPVVTGQDGMKALRVSLEIIKQIKRGGKGFQQNSHAH